MAIRREADVAAPHNPAQQFEDRRGDGAGDVESMGREAVDSGHAPHLHALPDASRAVHSSISRCL